MISNLKFYSASDNLFFWSDLHYCHAKDFILNPRGFKDAESHKKALIENWNATIPKDGIVFLLGDSVIGAGENSFSVFFDLFNASLNFEEIYIMQGNHGAGWNSWANGSSLTNSTDRFGRLAADNTDKTIYFIPNYSEIRVDNQLIVMSHYPLLSWNEQSKGSWHLHGHCHANLHKNAWLEEHYYSKKVIDIGVESYPAPLSYKRVQDIMDKKKIETFDHH